MLKDAILRLQLSISKNRGQSYDGAKTMSGEQNGVSKRFMEIEPRALYVWCNGHKANLSSGDAIKGLQLLEDALSYSNEIIKSLKLSPKRTALFERIKIEIGDPTIGKKHAYKIRTTVRFYYHLCYIFCYHFLTIYIKMYILPFSCLGGIKKLCRTRWTVKAKALLAILLNYVVLLKLNQEALETITDTDLKAKLGGILAKMAKFDFLFGLYLAYTVLRHVDNLATALQKRDLSAVEGYHMAQATIATMESLQTKVSTL